MNENGEPLKPSRRQALALLLSAGAASAGLSIPARAQGRPGGAPAAPAAGKPVSPQKPRLGIVSRHLQWADAETGIAVAKEAGLPAIMWTVRPGAHIEAANVETELPRIVKLTRAAGLETPMVITAIGDETSPNAERILATLHSLGIRFFRANAQGDSSGSVAAMYASATKRIATVAKLCEKYDTTAAFHTQGAFTGAAWDLWMVMKDLNPRYVGINYDIGHVMQAGGDGWRDSIRAVGPFLHSVAVKDFYWQKESNVPPGQWPWRNRFVPPGEGMVNFPDFFRYLQSIGFQGPIEHYFEYSVRVPGVDKPIDMLGSSYKQWQLEMPRATFVGFLKRDVDFYNQVWHTVMTTPPPPAYSIKAREPGADVGAPRGQGRGRQGTNQ